MRALENLLSFGPFQEPKEFDEHDDDLMHDVCGGPRLAEPIQNLLLSLSQFRKTEDSFGVNAERAMSILIPQLKALRAACKKEWEDSQ